MYSSTYVVPDAHAPQIHPYVENCNSPFHDTKKREHKTHSSLLSFVFPDVREEQDKWQVEADSHAASALWLEHCLYAATEAGKAKIARDTRA